ncbi:fungal hydrophobin domain-containing protein [Trichoderma aethiopicum]
MKSFAIITLFIAGILAAPQPNMKVPRDAVCTGLTSTPQCCATDVLGVADLDCQTPAGAVTDAQSFQAICAAGGQRARCCAIPVAGQDLLCQTPTGL